MEIKDADANFLIKKMNPKQEFISSTKYFICFIYFCILN